MLQKPTVNPTINARKVRSMAGGGQQDCCCGKSIYRVAKMSHFA